MSELKPFSNKPIMTKRESLLAVALWILLVICGFGLTVFIAGHEKIRDEQQWQRQLQMTAEAQRRQVEQWLSAQQAVITGLADNMTLRLYLSAIRDEDNENDESYLAFLRNLVISHARQYHFSEELNAGEVDANLEVAAGAGLALLDVEGNLITATLGMPAMESLPPIAKEGFAAKASSPIGPFSLADNKNSYLLIYAPIHGAQDDNTSPAIGYVVGIRQLDKDFDELLEPPPQAINTTETVLVRRNGEKLEYLTKLADGTEPMALSLNFDTPNLSEAFAFENAGVFARKIDYKNTKVFVVGQPVAETGWVLVSKVDEEVAMSENKKRRYLLVLGYLLAVGMVSSGLVALWRNMNAARAEQQASFYRTMAATIERQRELLSQLINTLITLVDSRDPHSIQHSSGVALIAGGIARTMRLPEDMEETTVFAAMLMNVGKIRAPEELLLQKQMSPEDKDYIRRLMMASAEILKDVDFGGPVVDTLKQAHEHVDGTGPLGLRDDAILLPAKIITVANAFVAMVSERAYRQAMSVDQALDILRKSTDNIYSRPVVVALEHYLENGNGKIELGRWQMRSAAGK